MEKSKNAADNFKKGLNCSQCVLSEFSEELGLSKEVALKIASGFGGGICQGEVCGAVTGAVMVLNLKYGNSKADDKEAKDKIYEVVRAFSKKFTDIHGSIICSDLLGIDLKQEENRKIARDKGLFKEKCPAFIVSATDILHDL